MADNVDWIPLHPGLNTTQALKMLGNNQSLYLRLLRKFHINHGHAIHEIRNAIDQGKQEESYRLAHSLKSVAATIGAQRLQGAVSLIVTGLKSGHDISAHLDESEKLLQEVLRSINQLLPQDKTT